MSSGDTVIFLGNPGKGKSTLLNGLMGTVAFESGVSMFSGMTCRLFEKRVGGVTYLDTPGFGDASQEMKKKSAQAINEALKRSGCFKVVFVTTLEAGRFAEADLALMRLILEHTPDLTEYYLIINKLSDRVFNEYVANDGAFLNELAKQGCRRVPSCCLLIQETDYLADKDNVLPPQDLINDVRAWVGSLRGIVVRERNYTSITPDDYHQKTRQLMAEIVALSQSQTQLNALVAMLRRQLELMGEEAEDNRHYYRRSRGVTCPNFHPLTLRDHRVTDAATWRCDGPSSGLGWLQGQSLSCHRGLDNFSTTYGIPCYRCMRCDYDLCDLCYSEEERRLT